MRKEFFRRAGQTAFIGGNHDAKRPLRPVVFESNAAERGVAAEKGFVGGLGGKTDSDASADFDEESAFEFEEADDDEDLGGLDEDIDDDLDDLDPSLIILIWMIWTRPQSSTSRAWRRRESRHRP